jgi:hypothetical protein
MRSAPVVSTAYHDRCAITRPKHSRLPTSCGAGEGGADGGGPDLGGGGADASDGLGGEDDADLGIDWTATLAQRYPDRGKWTSNEAFWVRRDARRRRDHRDRLPEISAGTCCGITSGPVWARDMRSRSRRVPSTINVSMARLCR